jgi:hypothetical protein
LNGGMWLENRREVDSESEKGEIELQKRKDYLIETLDEIPDLN